MAVEWFLLPLTGTGTDEDPFRPKYANSQDNPSVSRCSMVPFHPDGGLVRVVADQATLDAIAANSDATRTATESNIDVATTPQEATAIRNRLDQLGLPNQFVDDGETRRQIMRQLVSVVQIYQRLRGRTRGQTIRQRMTDNGLTLDSAWSSFPQGLKDELTAVAADFGFSPQDAGLTAASTLREILVTISGFFANKPIRIGGENL